MFIVHCDRSYNSDVDDCFGATDKCTMRAPFFAVLSRIHLPRRGSCETAAASTNSCPLVFARTVSPSDASDPSSVSSRRHESELRPPGASEMNCRELMNPGAWMVCVAAKVKDRIEGSMAHNRISPSQEPASQHCSPLRSTLTGREKICPPQRRQARDPPSTLHLVIEREIVDPVREWFGEDWLLFARVP